VVEILIDFLSVGKCVYIHECYGLIVMLKVLMFYLQHSKILLLQFLSASDVHDLYVTETML